VGELTLVASDTALMAVHFPTALHGSGGEVHDVDSETGLLARARQQLEEYFARTRTTFDLPLEPAGSAFQRRVWDALRAIPYGTTVSYSEIARRMGDVRATRAVGAANGQNPIPIIVPCHRVVGAHGELTGFGGGIDRKRWLLEHEGALLALGG
jgi:methylated-DNA-[protein]-cysteine S-methyltransferase